MTLDRPVFNSRKPAYFAGFFAFVLGLAFFGVNGAGGVLNMRLSTSSSLEGVGFFDVVMAGV